MIALNDNAVRYMERMGFRDIVLEVIKFSS